MARKILALRFDEGVVLIGAAADVGAPGRLRGRKSHMLASQLRIALAQNGDSRRLRKAALDWGVNSLGLRQQSDPELREQILALVDSGRLVVRFLPAYRGANDAPDVVAALRSLEPLLGDITQTNLSRRVIACLRRVPNYLATKLQSEFLAYFSSRRQAQIATIVTRRVERGFGQARAVKFKTNFLWLVSEGFGDFGEQLDLIDALAHRLAIATQAHEIDETAADVATLLTRLPWLRFIAAMNKLQLVPIASSGGTSAVSSPPRPPLRARPPERLLLRPTPAEIAKDFANEVTQEAALLAAARNGTPFCELCSQ